MSKTRKLAAILALAVEEAGGTVGACTTAHGPNGARADCPVATGPE
jgi:hypothetical protein